ncbi:MAG: TonB-dependent receptor [Crocinitomicaceae bacterium]|nr:TonB-dependent receptor [Crocinitomicaceae bacterium]
MKRIPLLITFIVFSFWAYPAEFAGVVKDKNSKEPIPYASISIVDLNVVIECDSVGLFRLNINVPSRFSLIVSAVGYESVQLALEENNPTSLEIFLEQSHLEFEEIIVSGFRNSLGAKTIANIESRSLEDLKLLTSNSLGDLIANIPGVYQNSTGVGISKPVIRGLGLNRVITYMNGLRIENQQWGADHGLGLTDLGIGRVEIIKGPASLLYGSDALGGVIYFVDEAYTKVNTVAAELGSRFESVSMGTKSYASVKFSKTNFRFNIYANHYNHADYELPSGLYGAESRFKGNSAKLSLGINKGKWVTNLRYNFLQNRLGIPGHTHDETIIPAEFQITTQGRENNLPAQENQNHYLLWENKFYFDYGKLEILLGHTRNLLTEFEEKFTKPALQLDLNSTTYNIRFNRSSDNKWKWTIGAQGMMQSNRNSDKAEESLIPNSNIFDNGIYGLINGQFGTWKVESGLRWDSRILAAFDSSVSVFSNTYQSINYSIGVAKFGKKFTFKTNLSTGFRAPHSSELLSDGVHHGTLRYEIGNENLVSEKANQLDTYLEYKAEHINFVVNPFVNFLQDYIAIEAMDTLIEGLPSFKYNQVDQVIMSGVDLGFHYHPHFAHFIHLESSFSIVFGEALDGQPLGLIPQPRANSSLKFELNSEKSFRLENVMVQHQYLFAQDRVASLESRSSAYQLFNIAANFNYKARINFSCGIRNLLNEQYIDHLSRLKNIGMYHPGRNFFVQVKFNLTTKQLNN